jgi:dTMP kinase
LKVRDGYLALAKAEPERWLVLDGRQSPDDLAGSIWQRMEALLASRSNPA